MKQEKREFNKIAEIPEDFTGIALLPSGSIYHILNGRVHREDGPAIYLPGKFEYWYLNGLRHRADGPAIDDNYEKEFWWHGKRVTPEEHFENLSEEEKFQAVWKLNEWKNKKTEEEE